MATYKVTFTHELYVEADNEEDAYEKALERASEYRLYEVDEVAVEFEH